MDILVEDVKETAVCIVADIKRRGPQVFLPRSEDEAMLWGREGWRTHLTIADAAYTLTDTLLYKARPHVKGFTQEILESLIRHHEDPQDNTHFLQTEAFAWHALEAAPTILIAAGVQPRALTAATAADSNSGRYLTGALLKSSCHSALATRYMQASDPC